MAKAKPKRNDATYTHKENDMKWEQSLDSYRAERAKALAAPAGDAADELELTDQEYADHADQMLRHAGLQLKNVRAESARLRAVIAALAAAIEALRPFTNPMQIAADDSRRRQRYIEALRLREAALGAAPPVIGPDGVPRRGAVADTGHQAPREST